MATPQANVVPGGPFPFILNAPHRFRPLSEVDWKSGADLNTIKLPEVDYINCFYIHITGTFNCAGAGTMKQPNGPWGLIKRIVLDTNEGGGEIVNFSGFGSYMDSLFRVSKGFRPDRAGMGDTTPHPDTYAAPVANGDNTWSLWFRVPVAVNRYGSRNSGLLNCQARGLRGGIKITTESPANVVTNGNTFVGTIEVYYEGYRVPNHYDAQGRLQVEIPELMRARTVEQVDDIHRAGELVKVVVPQDGTLYYVAHQVVINGVPSDAIDECQFVFIDEVTPSKIKRSWMREMMREHYGIEVPVGIYAHDFFAATQLVGDGHTADTLDTRNVALTESRIQIASTAVLGGNGLDYIRTVRMYTQKMRRQE